MTHDEFVQTVQNYFNDVQDSAKMFSSKYASPEIHPPHEITDVIFKVVDNCTQTARDAIMESLIEVFNLDLVKKHGLIEDDDEVLHIEIFSRRLFDIVQWRYVRNSDAFSYINFYNQEKIIDYIRSYNNDIINGALGWVIYQVEYIVNHLLENLDTKL